MLIDDEEDEIMEQLIEIAKTGSIPDIMNVPNGVIHSNESAKFNNIIYYDENSNFVQPVYRDSDYFERITTGAFILCR